MNKLRKIFVIVIFCICIFIMPSHSNAQEATSRGLQWLTSVQQSDGSWDNWTGTATRDTTTVADAFEILAPSSPAYSSALQWLATQTIINYDYASRKIYTLANAGDDVSSDLDYLIAGQKANGGWGLDIDHESSPFNTALALQALKAVNYPDQNIIYSAINYLTSAQNADGGWGFCSASNSGCGDGEAESNVYMTALNLLTLSQFKSTYDLHTEINNVVAYLLAHQNPDGSFGSGTVYETALSFIALIESGSVGAEHYAALQNTINFLINTQLPNGSWNDDPYSTALALRALALVKPNLSITSSDITFSNPTPTVGETISINAVVHNTGLAQADNIAVSFYDGDPDAGGLLIGETTIASIPAYENAPATINWTIPDASAHKIYVTIDPLNLIDEFDETDNEAYKNLTSSTLPDLSITSADITFSPLSLMPNETVTISATVRNNGETGASNVTVDLYDGDPEAGGILIGNITIPSIDLGNSADAQITTNFSAGSHDIYAVIDKADTILESKETNNKAKKTLYVGGGVDLSITDNDLSVSPAYPVEGNLVTINAVIHNEGEIEINNVLVRCYIGNIVTGGTQLGPDIVIPAISSRSAVVVSTTWDSTGHAGSKDIYVKVDPLDTISETNSSNNDAFTSLKVAARTGPDLTLSSPDINITPLNPVTGNTVTITANIRNTGVQDASNVPVEFSIGDPEVGGTLIIGSQTIPFIAHGSAAISQITWNTSGFTGNYELYANADPLNNIPETNEINNVTHMPLTITTPQGPDLTIPSIDTASLITNSQSLQISGSINVTLENKGNQNTSLPFVITAFEDSNGNKTLDRGTDNILGEATYTNNLIPMATDNINITVSGRVLFKDNLIYVSADSNNAIAELDETNNMRNTGQECEYIPPVGTFNPVQKWAWTGSSILPTYNQVISTPVVAHITDDNGDGVINDKDVPAVIFITYPPGYSQCQGRGVLRAVRGDNGNEIFTLSDLHNSLTWAGAPAIADIDGDGLIEIIAAKYGGGVIMAFEHDGTLKWQAPGDALCGGISIADIDNDGAPEIIIGATILNNNGTLRLQGTGGRGSNYGYGPISLVADIDLDGIPEIVAGNTVYKNNGTISWINTSVGDGYNAVANFDDDPYPEIVLVTQGSVYLLKYDGAKIWGPVAIPLGGLGGPPTVADFDGDGKPEIGVAGASRYVVFKSNGSILWQSITQDYSSHMTGSSVFDFDGDGQAEVVYNDEQYLRIYKASNGQVLFATPNSSITAFEYPIVVDVDNDNRAEMIVVANDYYGPSLINGKGFHGIRVFEDASDNWVNTRKIWNQHTYHITNVNDDGTIPRHEQNNWEIYNNYRCNALLPEEVNRTSDITASYLTIDQTNYPTSVYISVRIGNGGAVSRPAGVDITFYDGDPAQGGILIGTVTTTKAIDSGGYGDVSVTWNNPSSGNHNIYAVADKDNKFNECRENNNTASAEVALGIVTPVIYLPDLAVSRT